MRMRSATRPGGTGRSEVSTSWADGGRRAGVVVVLTLLLVAFWTSLAFAEDAPSTEPRSYTMQDGDRLVHLAKQFDVSVDAILEANKLSNGRGLRVGQKLVIPPPGTKATTKVSRVRRSEETYRVRKGDLMSRVARRFGVTVGEILLHNGMDSAKSLRAGQRLRIPVAGKAKAPTGSTAADSKAGKGGRPEPAWKVRARKLAKKLGLGTRRVAHRLLRGKLDPRWVRAAGKGRVPSTLRFPVPSRKIGRGWGSGPGGYHLAVDMPGRVGTRVGAVAPGIVGYANNELAGFGKLVLIIHPGGLVSGYAHNSAFRTMPGERVKRGTRIALLGSTGISRGPHVHFELIYNGQLCDPVPLFRPAPRGVRKRDQRIWPRRGGPPKGVRCAKRRRHPEYVGKPYGWRPSDWATRHRKNVGAQRGNVPEPDPDAVQAVENGD